jgi:hypothetical protein
MQTHHSSFDCPDYLNLLLTNGMAAVVRACVRLYGGARLLARYGRSLPPPAACVRA